jgi:carbamoylphosphate synthase large subunit
MMTKHSTQRLAGVIVATVALILSVGCSSMKTPATADVAVSKAAVQNAVDAGGGQFAPVEMNAAREKMALANKAMASKDYKLAAELANQAQVDAKLAQGKANSAKAQAAADALQDDIRVLREELDRNSK